MYMYKQQDLTTLQDYLPCAKVLGIIILGTNTSANERALKCKPRPHLRNCAHNNVSTIYRIMCHLGVKLVNNGFTRLQWRSCSL